MDKIPAILTRIELDSERARINLSQFWLNILRHLDLPRIRMRHLQHHKVRVQEIYRYHNMYFVEKKSLPLGAAAAGYAQANAGGIASARSSVLSSRAQAMKNSYKSQFGRQFVASTQDSTSNTVFTDPTPSAQQYQQNTSGYQKSSTYQNSSRYNNSSSTSSQSSSSSTTRRKKSRWE